jgi:hypothetical protein
MTRLHSLNDSRYPCGHATPRVSGHVRATGHTGDAFSEGRARGWGWSSTSIRAASTATSGGCVVVHPPYRWRCFDSPLSEAAPAAAGQYPGRDPAGLGQQRPSSSSTLARERPWHVSYQMVLPGLTRGEHERLLPFKTLSLVQPFRSPVGEERQWTAD